ncbi:uncharacterized protein LOC125000354 [Mugil cephalus]|uniref:uncharacterized protein LOC125000354 n=1 Tax=Mugil cephalus TaxID=48193 RepID=UPI001FB7245D|nr:uncharacterized protein LOC125000354 [Mugil cephalus]
MKLASTLPKGQNYKIYVDNYFTSVPLVAKLLEQGIHYGGTARQVRLQVHTSKYKYALKSRRWYMYIFWHTITLAVVNAWLLYKRYCQALKMPKKETLNMRMFQAQLASSLILVGTAPKTPKRGRPSAGNRSPGAAGSPLDAGKRPSLGDGSPSGPSSKKTCAHPPLDVRRDLTGHFIHKITRGRCRHCSKGYTNTQCSKCDVRLCFSEDKNCFWDYHCN